MSLAARVLAIGALAWVVAATAGPTAVDDAGERIHLERPAQRIVSLAPHTTEILFAVGAGERVVATVTSADYPPPARELPRVGRYDRIDLEAVVGREPDLVVAWGSGNPERQVARLRELGVTVYVNEPRSLEAIAVSMLELGRLAGVADRARRAADAYRQRLAALRARYAQRATVTVFYQIWDDPLMTVNGDHVIADVMRGCGGRNAFADLSALAPRIGIEAVLERDPDAIVASGTGDARPESLAMWRDWPELTAVERDHLFFVAPDILQRHTPRILDGMTRLCRQLERVRTREAAGSS